MLKSTLHLGLRALLATLAITSAAWAKPRLEISIAQQKEVVEVKGGARTVTLQPAQSASPGEVLLYTLTYSNKGDEVARDAVIDDPIPKGTVFVAGSAAGEGAEITYSNDGGKTFAPAVKLTYEVKLPNGTVEKRTASPDAYTHIRWTLKQVPPGASGTVTFRVKVA